MGRKKLAIKLIENKDSRYATFSKRRAGLIKKAQELSVLCEVDVALLVFSSAGNPYHFCSGDSLDDLLKRYQIYLSQAEAADAVTGNKKKEQSVDAWSSFADLLQSQAEKQEFEKLSIHELSGLEEQLNAALALVRSKKDRMLNEENKHLKEIVNVLLVSGKCDNPKDDAAVGQEVDGMESSTMDKVTLHLLQ